MRLVTVEEMRSIEKEANEKGLSYEEMMSHAGEGVASMTEKYFGGLKSQPVVGLVGSGNNGGDTLIALTLLQKNGWKTCAFLYKERVDDPLVRNYLEVGGKTFLGGEKGFPATVHTVMGAAGVVLDGVLGTGFTLPLKEDVQKFLKVIGDEITVQRVIAVDCPSGVDCDSGQMAKEALKADLTVCMEAVKTGLLLFPAFEYCGEIVTVPIGLKKTAREGTPSHRVLDTEWVKSVIPARPMKGHKGTFGTVMVVGGSVNYVGAPLLAGWAAYRMGSGLVAMAIPQSIQSMLAGQLPEAIWLLLNDEDGVISESAAELIADQFSKVNALVIGPGLGREETTERFLEALFFPKASTGKRRRVGFLVEESPMDQSEKKMPTIVLDADGLRWLAARKNWSENFGGKMVLTPHPGEMAALTGLSVDEIQSDRLSVAEKYAKIWKKVVVLKGALTVIAAPDGRVSVVPVADSALAKAGSGDVLSGMIASLIGQGVPDYEAASAAAWLHTRAGQKATVQIGNRASVMATDIIHAIASALVE
jgi:NAD(P)H-hydrate epimerase